MRNTLAKRAAVIACATFAVQGIAQAGGGGQNMLLIVNPKDEGALRMANAYAKARAIPDSNILFINNPTAATSGYNLSTIAYTAYNTSYKTAVPTAITARGLDAQIDYIGTIGTPHVVNGSAPNGVSGNTSIKMGFNYFLSMNTQFTRGMFYPDADFRASELFKVLPPTNGSALNYTKNTNSAIHHSTEYTVPGGVTKPAGWNTAAWYMSGSIGTTNGFGIGTQQYIDAYTRSVGGDGTKPPGKVYFIETGDAARTGTRKPYWASVQNYMTANGIAWEQLGGSTYQFVGTPINKPDVVGGVVGAANYPVPNGSTYLPGSWLDSLTSSGGSYGGSGQTKADRFIRAGAAGSAGTVTEPFAIADRFTQSTFYIFNHEGSTLAESYAMSVKRPDLLMFQGDMLSQAYADMPNVTLSGASASPVSGSLALSASASLTNPSIATGISKIELFVDGKSKGLFSAGNFNLDTTGLTDGRHEVRAVAYNNAAAESQGYDLDYITVNNKGQSVGVSGSNDIDASWNQVLAVPVSATVGTGAAISRIELRSLGRNVGQVNGASGNISLDAKQLAFGDNTLVPVAVLADGKEVRGAEIVISRDFNKLTGKPTVPAPYKQAGFKFEYFANAAGNTLAQTNLTVSPTTTLQGNVLSIDPSSNDTDMNNTPTQFRNNNNAKMAVRVTASFDITTPGEYTFWFGGGRFESLEMTIDGLVQQKHELWTGSAFTSANTLTGTETSHSEYLLPGRHDLQLLLANGGSAADTDANIGLEFWYRDPAGDFHQMDSSLFYTVVPEPGTISVLAAMSVAGLARRRKRVS